MRWRLWILSVVLAAVACAEEERVTLDLRPHWDAAFPLANPHKGWYHHYFDNTVEKYLLKDDQELTAFPGMDHLYLRLAWSYLEPREGEFTWSLIDEQIDKWTKLGLGVSFRISCKETGTNRIEQQFATPRWVRDAGAKGSHYSKGQTMGADAPWEPVYDDPVFLQKLDAFLAAFAARYDGKPWLRYLDIGSFGDWGEGHTFFGSRRKYGYDALAQHVNLHVKHFRKTPLVVSDDYVTSLDNPQDRRRLHELIVTNNISYRDDSILVDWYLTTCSKTFTVRSPELFADVWKSRPTVFELEHYGTVKKMGNWVARPGSSLATFGEGKSGADYFRGALEQLRATYIGYHGFAREWLNDNPALTGELLNRCGYWYFPHALEMPAILVPGQTHLLSVTWENRGVACAYHPYTLMIKLEGPSSFQCEQPSGNLRWMPGSASPCKEQYALAVPSTLPPGSYALKLKLCAREAGRDVRLPLTSTLQESDGYYKIGTVRVLQPSASSGAEKKPEQ